MQFVCGKGHAPGFSQLRAPYSKRPVKGDNNLRFGGETYRKEEANMTMVYVVSKNGKPLMPTRRCGHVRILLKQKKAARSGCFTTHRRSFSLYTLALIQGEQTSACLS